MMMPGILALTLMGCGTGKKATALGTLAGEWNITSVQGEKPEEGTNPFLGFDLDEKHVYGNSGCNLLSGELRAETKKPGKLQLGNMASTRMMCPDMKTEQRVLAALNKVAGYEQAGNEVRLTDAQGKVLLTLVKRASGTFGINDLAGKWNITMVDGKPVGKTDKQPFIGFDIDRKRVSGNAGCNIINGGFSQEEGQASSLRFTEMIATMMACPDMDAEAKILKALNSVRRFESRARNTVSFIDENGTEVLTLTKAY